MPLPDTKAVMTAEERAKEAYGDICNETGRGGSAAQVAIIEQAIREAVEAERDRWMQATEHEHTCEYVQSPQTLCTCGAHVRLALLHGEAAYAIRARKVSHDS